MAGVDECPTNNTPLRVKNRVRVMIRVRARFRIDCGVVWCSRERV